MLLKASPALLIRSPAVTDAVIGSGGPLASLSPLSSVLRLPQRKRRDGSAVVAAAAGENLGPLTGVVFQPFEELKPELALLSQDYHVSLARTNYVDKCEAAINEQINIEYNASYIYHALFAYFDRDNIAFRGLAKFFKESSEEEREHAEKLMKYQNKRGGRVKLQVISTPLSEFDNSEKGDALFAMELTLSLEKLIYVKLLNLHSVAAECNDPQMTDFVESEFLTEQVEAIKKIAEYVAQLRRVGKGHGEWHFDQMLLNEVNEGEADAA